jgi:site-specific DNA-methyltransferase (adenine-specific)
MSIELYNLDCMEGMKRYPDKHFELACVDVPYGIGESMNDNASRGNLAIAKDYGRKEWDKQPPSLEYFIELMRISNNQIIWGANHFISHIPFNSSCWIVWDKVNYGNDFADCELAWTSFDSAVRKFTFQWNGMLQGDMKNKEHRIHPTQKPVKLYEWLLKNYAKQGDKILDTHLGSGSIAIACYNLDFSLTGFEIDKDYYNGAVNRLEEHKKQQRLFG